jgi:hypothetical protein
MALAFLVV